MVNHSCMRLKFSMSASKSALLTPLRSRPPPPRPPPPAPRVGAPIRPMRPMPPPPPLPPPPPPPMRPPPLAPMRPVRWTGRASEKARLTRPPALDPPAPAGRTTLRPDDRRATMSPAGASSMASVRPSSCTPLYCLMASAASARRANTTCAVPSDRPLGSKCNLASEISPTLANNSSTSRCDTLKSRLDTTSFVPADAAPPRGPSRPAKDPPRPRPCFGW
mmetsp:Transcript_21698/g.36953  ORF Transcript_21698/g.36953 Transcript_21698/m.36953 type:complete len:220 (-) Transcript_21698:442-1101(-)